MSNILLLSRLFLKSMAGSAQSTYEARYQLLQGVAAKLGFRVYNKNLAWHKDEQYLHAWRGFPEANKWVHERRFNLFNLARSMRVVPGDLAECGVFRGAGSYLMLEATAGTEKHLHGFDSFEGLSTPTPQDVVDNDYTFKWQPNDMAVPGEISRRNLTAFEGRFDLYPGWIPSRFGEVESQKFCMVHIDVDLYQPTLDAATFFYQRLSSGGFLVCDDYGSEACPGAKRAMDEVAAAAGTCVVHLTSGQGLIFRASPP